MKKYISTHTKHKAVFAQDKCVPRDTPIYYRLYETEIICTKFVTKTGYLALKHQE